MLAAASVMNRKQVPKQRGWGGGRFATQNKRPDVSTCSTMLNVNENEPQTDALFTREQNYKAVVFFFISRTTKITTLRDRVKKR
jgi:hypothetical protein